MKAILLNGPPGSGKDTAAGIIQRELGIKNCEHFKLAQPVKEAVGAFFGLSSEEFFNLEQGRKETGCSELLGKTPRCVQIWVAAQAKWELGNGCFSHLMLRRWSKLCPGKTAVVSDLGFQEELETFLESLGTENIHLVQLFRPNCTFRGDSRGYVEDSRVAKSTIANTGGLPTFGEKVTNMVWRTTK